MEKVIKCTIKQGVSKKTNNPYICAEIDFGNGYKKVIFPENNAEKFVFENYMKGDRQ